MTHISLGSQYQPVAAQQILSSGAKPFFSHAKGASVLGARTCKNERVDAPATPVTQRNIAILNPGKMFRLLCLMSYFLNSASAQSTGDETSTSPLVSTLKPGSSVAQQVFVFTFSGIVALSLLVYLCYLCIRDLPRYSCRMDVDESCCGDRISRCLSSTWQGITSCPTRVLRCLGYQSAYEQGVSRLSFTSSMSHSQRFSVSGHVNNASSGDYSVEIHRSDVQSGRNSPVASTSYGALD